jgi:hypothetical protein
VEEYFRCCNEDTVAKLAMQSARISYTAPLAVYGGLQTDRLIKFFILCICLEIRPIWSGRKN